MSLALVLTASQIIGAHNSVAQTTSIAPTSSTTTLAPLPIGGVPPTNRVVPPLKRLALQTVVTGLVEPVDVAAPLDDGRLLVKVGDLSMPRNARFNARLAFGTTKSNFRTSGHCGFERVGGGLARLAEVIGIDIGCSVDVKICRNENRFPAKLDRVGSDG